MLTWRGKGFDELGVGRGGGVVETPTGDRRRRYQLQIGAGSTWSTAAAGYLHTGAIRTDGTLWEWCNNGGGQLGEGTSNDPAHANSHRQSNDSAIVAVGGAHIIAAHSI
jgi:alpha-tubulin suppressor-like RCC1 family protein